MTTQTITIERSKLEVVLEALEQTYAGNYKRKALEAIPFIKEALAQPEQEPVAGLLVGQDSDGRYVSIAAKAHADTLPLGEYKLYTSPPPQRKPLPSGEWPKHPSAYVGMDYVGYGKADLDNYAIQVLALHGIKE